MKKYTTVIAIASMGLLFGGCASKYTSFIPEKSSINQVYVNVSQDSSLGQFTETSTKLTNLKYLFGAAATKTKKEGYKNFSIILPHVAKEIFQENKIKGFEDVYKICSEGKHSFQWSFSTLNRNEGCETFVQTVHGGAGSHVYPLTMKIEYHNDNRNDGATFNADEVLESKLVKSLEKSKFEEQ